MQNLEISYRWTYLQGSNRDIDVEKEGMDMRWDEGNLVRDKYTTMCQYSFKRNFVKIGWYKIKWYRHSRNYSQLPMASYDKIGI